METPLQLQVRRVEGAVDAERAFVHLYGDSPSAFWLDSSRPGERARFSFAGDSRGPLGAVVTYDVEAGEVRVERDDGVETIRESIFDYLGRETRRLRIPSAGLPFDFDCGFAGYLGYELKADCEGDATHRSAQPDAAFVFADRLLAFDHLEGCAYLLCVTAPDGAEEGEEWLEETGRRLAALPPLAEPRGAAGDPVEFRLSRSHERYLEDIDACKRRLFEGETYEVCLTNRIAAGIACADPLALYRVLRRVNPAPFAAFLRFGEVAVLSSSPERFLSVGRDRWAEARPIKGTRRRGETPAEDARLAEELRADEKSRAENVTIVDLLRNDLGIACADPLALYRVLRRVNPAPFAAFLRFGEVAVLSSSPERFLHIGCDRWAEARPIKGTARRGDTPEEDARLAKELRADEKSRAENVTIVDLLRNDLGIVCEYGTVHVPELMRVETYETVHQLVSTVRGRLREEVAPLECVRACFPPGSMTGAPKKRTMEIIDELEGEARGVYSGAIGYLGLGGGCDLSVVIRTIAIDGDSTTIGVGGAIVLESDPEDEYQEALLKGRASMRAVDQTLRRPSGAERA